ncbi:MAG: hypothetical protein HZB50_14215 [Chloroflexi bacterium]|nr:hypothetical protein [Chloroflexota bacterium]
MKRSLLLILILFCTSCSMQNSTPSEPVVVTPMVSTEDPTIPIPDCQPASGATFRLQQISDTIVELIATGLQPGDYPRVFFNSTYNGKNAGPGGMYDTNKVLESGEYFFELGRLDPPEDKVSMTWEIRLQHAHGVECASIVLP